MTCEEELVKKLRTPTILNRIRTETSHKFPQIPVDFSRKYLLNVGNHTQIQYSFHKNPLKVNNETITEGIKAELKFNDRFVEPRPAPLATILSYISKNIFCFVGEVTTF